MSIIKISKSAYFNNLTQISNKLGSKDRIFVVLKDNAYGHGIMHLSQLAYEFGIKKAVVRSFCEAQEIQNFFEQILILSHLPNAKEVQNPKFIYAINDMSGLKNINNGVFVHLALDLMMHRNGLKECELNDAFKLAQEKNIKICGAYTHFSQADELSASFMIQKERFNKNKEIIKQLCNKFSMPTPLFHSCNSAALERSNFIDENESVRIGIAQYGYCQFQSNLSLKRVLKLYAHKISTRELKTGQCVGYGGVFCASHNMKISTYDLGYGDGLFRYNGKDEFVFANNIKMLGRMSMDSFSANSTDDEICVIDDAEIWAKKFNTICYDVLVKLSNNINRVVVQ